MKLRTSLITALALTCASSAFALSIVEVEPNDSVFSAQNINAFFSLDFSPDIGDSSGNNTSTTIPHVSISGSGNNPGSGTRDFFMFNVSTAGSIGIFDIDYGKPDLDSMIELFDSVATSLASNDDYSPFATVGAGGSVHSYDSFIQYTFPSAGNYVIAVGRFSGHSPLNLGEDYVLQVSIANHSLAAVPDAGSSLAFLSLGMLSLLGMTRFLKPRVA